MWNEIFQVAISNGIFALLFVALLLYQLRDSANREKKYQDTIQRLSKHISVIEDIKSDVDEIKDMLSYKKRKVKKSETETKKEDVVV